jgi:predicted transcriptional regulator
MNQQTINDVLELRVQGYSIRDIAAELGIPKSRVEKCLNENRDELDRLILDVADEPQPTPELDSTMIESLKRLEELHADIVRERSEMAQKKAELEKMLSEMPNKQQVIEEYRKKSREAKLVNRTNRLINEVLDNCDDCSWSGDDIDDFQERAESLKDRVKSFCDANDIDETKLLIYQAITFLINDIEEEQSHQTSGFFGMLTGPSITITYSEKHKDKIKSYLITDFHQQSPIPVLPSETKDIEDDSWTDEDD